MVEKSKTKLVQMEGTWDDIKAALHKNQGKGETPLTTSPQAPKREKKYILSTPPGSFQKLEYNEAGGKKRAVAKVTIGADDAGRSIPLTFKLSPDTRPRRTWDNSRRQVTGFIEGTVDEESQLYADAVEAFSKVLPQATVEPGAVMEFVCQHPLYLRVYTGSNGLMRVGNLRLELPEEAS